MRPILPPDILTRRKIGFRVPVSLWFRTTLKDFVHENLSGPPLHARAIFTAEDITKIIDQHNTGRINHEKLIWSLLSFELFQKEYGLGF